MTARTLAGMALVALVALAALLTLAPSRAAAQAKASDSVVKASATATPPDADGKQVVTITLNITDPKFHLYANPVGNEDLVSNQVKVTIDKVQSAKIDYPLGEVVKDKVVGDYKIYHGKVTIKATVQRAKGDTGALPVSIKVQACDHSRCLRDSTIRLSVP